ncbi:ATP-binding protein [Caminibacter mediatlanticus]|uniref:Uncharacterized protein n=1 Tax=Caminibacter mediatlanticus TB-2 TaxID=391592 RepID=A0AAI9AFW6_9BACT|nr:ATP-binding protein [Caminibacter mediatlanticus]EDM22876.1 hypothetical protein CMTB2_00249 [Caminibacter mediatlanticus TB-2]
MNKIYFFNAANFNFAEIDLRKKNIFFVGDNGSGKTTAIRAIHFYYNSDVKALGIDSNKQSFKDFYFKYDNSFIVYEFEDYFVLMYKRRGDIKRVFSKQKFNVNRLIKDSKIVDLNEAISYANEASLKYRPQTNEEYKKIIYGLDRKHLDFKLTTIRNYNTFINLYNKIFNVNKAVFDAKSIKETIFTTLDRVEVGEINYEDFASELSEYRQYFIFYQRFKSQSENIEKLYLYKNALINLKEELNEILEKIAYKKEIEEKEVEELKDKLKSLFEVKKLKLKQIGYFDKKIKNIIKNIETNLLEIETKLNEIKKLKEKFSLNKLQQAREKVAKKEELEKRVISIKTSLNELIKGIKNQVEEIEEEINRLKREKRVLKDRIKEEEIRKKRDLEEKYYELLNNEKEKIELKEKELNEEISKLYNEISKIEDEKNTLKKELDEVKNKFLQKEEEIKSEVKKLINELKNKKRDLELKKDEYLNEIISLKKELNRLKTNYKDQIEDIAIFYKKEFDKIEEKIKFYENILKTKPNSFKEFLNQNVDDWEEVLYPVIDESLLSKDINELKPKIISTPVFGISLDTSNLKSIPTMKKAEEEIERLKLLKASLNEEKNKKFSILEKEFKSKEIEITSKIEVNEEKIKEIEIESKNIEKEIENLNKNLQNKLKELENLKEEEIKLIKININRKNEIIKKLYIKIDKFKNEIKKLKKEFENIKKSLNIEKQKEYEEIKKALNEKLQKESLKLDEKIKNLEDKKDNISKDERIIELNEEIEIIEKELKEIEKEEFFLKEYEEKREFLEKEDEFKTKKEKFLDYQKRLDEFFNKMDRLLNEKVTSIEKEIKKLEERIDLINEGLKKVKNLVLPENKKKTNEYLSVLIDEYYKKDGDFKEKRINFKDIASSIKTALDRFSIDGLDVGFNIENLANLEKNELERVDELYIFKDKKFEVLNKTRVKGLKNLINGILEKRIDNFEVAKEDFLDQIRKINNNLSKVDFGIIKEIKIEIEESKKNILKVFEEIKELIQDVVNIIDNKDSLFFNENESDRKLRKIEDLFNYIRKEIQKNSFSLIDVIDINVKFIENEKENNLKIIKNESSTGGSILLKIAIAVSLLELFLKEKATLFLILDEVSVLSTKNQKLLKNYVNERGLGVIYVTPDLPLVDVDEIDIYKFRNVKGEFEVVRLIGEDGIKI